MVDHDLYEGMYEPAFSIGRGAELASSPVGSIKAWLHLGNLRLLEADARAGSHGRAALISPATVVVFAVTSALVQEGVLARRACGMAMSFALGSGGGQRLPGRLFADCGLEGVETWAALPTGCDAEGRIIAVSVDEPVRRLHERLPRFGGGRGLHLVPLDQVVVETLIRCRQAPRRPRREDRDEVECDAA